MFNITKYYIDDSKIKCENFSEGHKKKKIYRGVPIFTDCLILLNNIILVISVASVCSYQLNA